MKASRCPLVYESPRITHSDPPPPSNRWESIQQQAGPHSQSYTQLDCRRRPRSALVHGLPSHVAQRVEQVHLPSEELPEWLDVIQEYGALRELRVEQKEDETEEARQARRLYILYRLPKLRSIDGIAVTTEERLLARPNDPPEVQVQESTIDEPHAKVSSKHARGGSLVLNASPERKSTTRARLVSALRYLDETNHTSSSSLDDFSMTSSAAVDRTCHWTAACGGLALPFRCDPSRRISNGKLFRRRKEKIETENETQKHDTQKLKEEKSESAGQKAETRGVKTTPTRPRVHTKPRSRLPEASLLDKAFSGSPSSSAMGESLAVDRTPPRKAVEFDALPGAPSIPQGVNPNLSPYSSASLSGSSSTRIPASKSLSSPFPMQFRTRLKPVQTQFSDETPAPLLAPRSEVPLVRVQSSPSKLEKVPWRPGLVESITEELSDEEVLLEDIPLD